MTSRELTLAFEAADWRAGRERDRDAWLVWHIAVLQRKARLPSFQSFIQSRQPPQVLSARELEQRRKEHERLVEIVRKNRAR